MILYIPKDFKNLYKHKYFSFKKGLRGFNMFKTAETTFSFRQNLFLYPKKFYWAVVCLLAALYQCHIVQFWFLE